MSMTATDASYSHFSSSLGAHSQVRRREVLDLSQEQFSVAIQECTDPCSMCDGLTTSR